MHVSLDVVRPGALTLGVFLIVCVVDATSLAAWAAMLDEFVWSAQLIRHPIWLFAPATEPEFAAVRVFASDRLREGVIVSAGISADTAPTIESNIDAIISFFIISFVWDEGGVGLHPTTLVIRLQIVIVTDVVLIFALTALTA